MTDDVIVRTAEGRVRGTRDGQALRFLGIPYAQSPITAGRFAGPVPHARAVCQAGPPAERRLRAALK